MRLLWIKKDQAVFHVHICSKRTPGDSNAAHICCYTRQRRGLLFLRIDRFFAPRSIRFAAMKSFFFFFFTRRKTVRSSDATTGLTTVRVVAATRRRAQQKGEKKATKKKSPRKRTRIHREVLSKRLGLPSELRAELSCQTYDEVMN